MSTSRQCRPAWVTAPAPLQPTNQFTQDQTTILSPSRSVQAAGLDSSLGPDFEGTVFAPTNEAFTALLKRLNLTPEVRVCLAGCGAQVPRGLPRWGPAPTFPPCLPTPPRAHVCTCIAHKRAYMCAPRLPIQAYSAAPPMR